MQRALDGRRISGDRPKIGARRLVGLLGTLLPIPQRAGPPPQVRAEVLQRLPLGALPALHPGHMSLYLLLHRLHVEACTFLHRWKRY